MNWELIMQIIGAIIVGTLTLTAIFLAITLPIVHQAEEQAGRWGGHHE